MKVTPVASPLDIKSAPASDLRSKAIEAFKAGTSSFDEKPASTGQAQETAVANPNSVSPEEMSAVRAPAKEPVVQEATAETTPVDATTQAPQKDPAVSRLYAQLAKQERALRAKAQAQEKQFQQREAAIQAREAEAQQKSEINQKGFVSMERIKNDILGVMAEAGVPYDEVVQQLVNPTKVDPRLQATIDALKSEISELKKSSEQGREEMTKQQQAQYNAALKQIEIDARNLVNSDPDLDIVKQAGAVKDIVKLIEKTYNQDGVLMTVEEAASEIADYIEERTKKLVESNRFKRKLASQTNNATQAQKTTQTADTKGQDSAPAGNVGMKTLTNAASSTRKLSARERAILAFKGESRS